MNAAPDADELRLEDCKGPVIIGEANDPHVTAVATALLERDVQATIFEASRLRAGFTFDLSAVEPHRAAGLRGWVRRLAPPGWTTDHAPGSHEGVIASSWLALLTGWLSVYPVNWLTTFDSLVSAESKMRQLAIAHSLGIRTPRTLLTSSAAQLREAFPIDVVAKPLGPGQMFDQDGRGVSIPATLVRTADLIDREVAAAPFLFQEPIAARRHLRVVTVGSRAWAASLAADGIPLDWRQYDPAHDNFRQSPDHPVCHRAKLLAGALGVGYSSQDWIETRDDLVFLDLNPAGQWLFLPPEVSGPVTQAIAGWLETRTGNASD